MNYLLEPALPWLSKILEERFGYHFVLSLSGASLSLSREGRNGTIVFDTLNPTFCQPGVEQPYCEWSPESEGYISVLGGEIPTPGASVFKLPLIRQCEITQVTYVGYDILGLTYWMLNRIEEIGSTALDNHGRFPATSSHAFKHGYLERPVVDEWLHVLGQVVQRVWPDIELKQHKFSMKVSHDVDSPSLYQFKPWKTIIRIMAGHLIKHRDIKAFLQGPYIKLTAGKRLHQQDPYNTFDWLMSISEANNLTSAFYFICGSTSNMDADYQPEDPAIRELMKHMYQRGHEIGLHPSYGTYQKPELIVQEANRLRAACKTAGVTQTEFGGRMHYLRWEHPTTLQAWENAGMAYDTTLSYADRPGFRCGTCFEYPAFNPETRQQLKIRIRPLIAMEGSIIDPAYLGLGNTEKAENKFLELKDKCRRLGGCFTVLWHNSYFANDIGLKKMYQDVLEG